MMFGITFKAGCDTRVLGKAGVRILCALDSLARHYARDIVITCANDGHAAPDPHVSGEAFDVRTRDLSADQKQALLHELIITLSEDPVNDSPKPVSIGLATRRFYAQLENAGKPGEHIHVQRRNGTVY